MTMNDICSLIPIGAPCVSMDSIAFIVKKQIS